METTETPESTVNREEKEEKKGAGLFANFLNKLGLGGAAGEGAGIGVGSVRIGAAGGGLGGGGILATKAGIVALIVAGTTVAAGIGVVGRSVLSAKPGGVTDGIYSLFPGKSGSGSKGSAAGASGNVEGASSSLDYMAQAAKNDPFLQEQAAEASAAAAAASADALPPNQVAAPDHNNAPANVGSARTGPKLAKMAGLSGSSSGGSGGSMSARAPEGGSQRAMGGGRVGGMTAMNRPMMSSGSGRRALVGSRGQRAGDQARSALRDGNRAGGMRNPTMAAAGRTFDGAAPGGLQSSPAGGPTAMDSGGVGNGARDRFSPNKTLDTRELPPVKKVDSEKNGTPYQTQMWVAIGAIVVGMLALAILGGLKKKLEAAAVKLRAAMGDPTAIAEFNSVIMWGKVLAGLATAAGALATAMGVMIITGFGQKMQGGLLAAIGGILTLQAGMKFMDLMKVDPVSADTELAAVDGAVKSFGDAISSSFFGGGF